MAPRILPVCLPAHTQVSNLSFLTLPYLILSYLNLSYLILSYLLTHRGFNTLSGYYTGSEHYLPYIILSYTKLAYLIISYLIFRGFNTFSGYYTGAEHYFSHVRDKGYDFRRNDNVDFSARGNYSTDLFNQEAVSI